MQRKNKQAVTPRDNTLKLWIVTDCLINTICIPIGGISYYMRREYSCQSGNKSLQVCDNANFNKLLII